jgi:hypothetical protein
MDDWQPKHRFARKTPPPYMQRSPCLESTLPVLHLRRLSTGGFSEAL